MRTYGLPRFSSSNALSAAADRPSRASSTEPRIRGFCRLLEALIDGAFRFFASYFFAPAEYKRAQTWTAGSNARNAYVADPAAVVAHNRLSLHLKDTTEVQWKNMKSVPRGSAGGGGGRYGHANSSTISPSSNSCILQLRN